MNVAVDQVVIHRFTEAHIEGVTALYNDPEVCRQVLQMPYQSADVWRKRLAGADDRSVKLVALHQGQVIGNIGKWLWF